MKYCNLGTFKDLLHQIPKLLKFSGSILFSRTFQVLEKMDIFIEDTMSCGQREGKGGQLSDVNTRLHLQLFHNTMQHCPNHNTVSALPQYSHTTAACEILA